MIFGRDISGRSMRAPLLATTIMLLCLAHCEHVRANEGAPVWPTKEWPTSAPEAQGMSSAGLVKLIDYGAGHDQDSLLVIRHGVLVTEVYYAPFRAGVKHRLYSVTKAVISTLFAIAVKDGTLDSTDRRILDFFPGRSVANLDARKEAITLQNLLDMESGLDWSDASTFEAMRRSPDWEQFVLDRPMWEAPGAFHNYNSGNAQLLSAILTRLTGMSALDYARRRLFGPLGISDVSWPSDPQGISNGGNGLAMEPRDMAKLGYLLLRKGTWDREEIFAPAWIDRILRASVATDAPNLRCSSLFWVPRNGDAFLARGHHGQRIFVMPALDIVAVATGASDSASIEDEIALIAGAAPSSEPLPKNDEAQALLETRIREAATGKASPAGDAPEIAKLVSGRVYRFPENPLRLSAVSFNLTGPDPSYAYEVATGRPDKPFERFEGPIGVDGRYRTGAPGRDGIITAAKGAWSDDRSFVVEFEDLGADDMRQAIFSFEGKKMDMILKSESGPDVELHGEASD
jgi:CubicO group peptidase (beta-lactamase class C family)